MEAPISTDASTRLLPAIDGNPSPPSVAINETLEEEDIEDLNTSDSPLHLFKKATLLQDGLPVDVVLEAGVPTSPGYFTDAFLGGAALRPDASSQLKELCLSAQNARTTNEIPRQPARDHWAFLLEEAKTFREDMRQKRENFIQVAKDAADLARWGFGERRKRRRGDLRAWRRYRRRTALTEEWTTEEAAEDAVESARLAFAEYVGRQKHRQV